MKEKINEIIEDISNANTVLDENQVYEKILLIFEEIQKDLLELNKIEKENFLRSIISFLGNINSSVYNKMGYKILKENDINNELKFIASCISKLKNSNVSAEDSENNDVKLLEQAAQKLDSLENELKETKQEVISANKELNIKQKETESYLELIQYLLSDLEDLSETEETKRIKDNIELTLKTNGILIDWNPDEQSNEKFEIIKTEIKRKRKVGLPCLLRKGKVICMGTIFEEIEK